MKKSIYILLGIALVAILTTACSKEKIALYDGCKSGLFIQEVYSTDIYGNPLSYIDSTTFSFASQSENVKTYTLRFYVRTMGRAVDYPRPYKIVVMDESTAVLNEDFDLDQNDFTILPNECRDTVFVRCHRSAKLRKETLRIRLAIEPNEHFETPITEYKNSSSWSTDGPMNSAISYLIKFNEIYSKPNYWGWFGDGYFGSFTVNKYLELNKVMGWTVTDWRNAGGTGAKVVAGRFDFAARTFQKHLQNRADEGNPLMDDDGVSYVQLPSKYAVDYSHIGSKK